MSRVTARCFRGRRKCVVVIGGVPSHTAGSCTWSEAARAGELAVARTGGQVPVSVLAGRWRTVAWSYDPGRAADPGG